MHFLKRSLKTPTNARERNFNLTDNPGYNIVHKKGRWVVRNYHRRLRLLVWVCSETERRVTYLYAELAGFFRFGLVMTSRSGRRLGALSDEGRRLAGRPSNSASNESRPEERLDVEELRDLGEAGLRSKLRERRRFSSVNGRLSSCRDESLLSALGRLMPRDGRSSSCMVSGEATSLCSSLAGAGLRSSTSSRTGGGETTSPASEGSSAMGSM